MTQRSDRDEHVAELVAGLRTTGSADPVDYELPAAFTPNHHWPWPHLDAALWNLAVVQRDAGDATCRTGSGRCGNLLAPASSDPSTRTSRRRCPRRTATPGLPWHHRSRRTRDRNRREASGSAGARAAADR
ncbi:hypothetical protein CS0771_57430 [Catellatospora sp. IY07-71]|nr:hypothetical protein CS0771_57430 [Catellatospora sp. IY07-71]